ncbi:Uncharacterised protein [Escherichia coli]|nr:Uncharacterised protein [Escherichia coli]
MEWLSEIRKLRKNVPVGIQVDWPPESPDNQYHLNK